ncbi:cell division cycle 5-like protein [Brevipalpus obovatus]|uniref:cell division cycle 5-like protein n=1 Tax=Brevipalpus obovatus TaxID=246614 RepID=UPI003D9F1095
MGRIMIKGGIWKNTEDEILKAAVMKYGKNQWSRIASLLHRKSAKQCKARWFEWLDPSIKKTEWSREEEEKLLHMAKMMPNQWRSIAFIVGRTTSQCLEHYDHLLEQAQRKDEADLADDPRKLKPGEVDPNPETKPARPDPVDMDEDELEMLSEARAGLANTQGKKAKRKAREKQLEEARRLASLQKRRELRMAGIFLGSGSRRKKRGIDYNTEIPFEKPVPVGLHDVSDETFTPASRDFRKLRQQHLDGESRAEKEDRERKKDKERSDKNENNAPPINASEHTIPIKRSKLVLPAPQISDAELEQVVKIGKTSLAVKETAEESGNLASETLLADYSVTPSDAISARTPKVPSLSRDTILMEAQNLIALTNVETPLKGGENTPLHVIEGGIGAPKTPVSATPNNMIVAPFRTPGTSSQFDGSERSFRTPGSVSMQGEKTPILTPLRDKLNINPDESLESDLIMRVHEKDSRQNLHKALSSLPAPSKEFEIVLSEEESKLLKSKQASETQSIITDDQADLDAGQLAEMEAAAEIHRLKQTQAVQRDLPRPTEINDKIMSNASGPEKLIAEETLYLLHYDAIHNPTEDQLVAQASGSKNSSVQHHESFLRDYRKRHNFHPDSSIDNEFSTESLEEARDLINNEMLNLITEVLPDKNNMNSEEFLERYSKVWEECRRRLIFCSSQGEYLEVKPRERRDDEKFASVKDQVDFFEKQFKRYLKFVKL